MRLKVVLDDAGVLAYNLLVLEGPRYFPCCSDIPEFVKPLVDNSIAEWDPDEKMLFLLCQGERLMGPAGNRFSLLQ